MTLRKFIVISMLLLGYVNCQAIQPVWDEVQPGQGIFSSMGLSPEAAQMVFGEKINSLLKNVWALTVRSAWIAFHSRFFKEIQWLEKNYVIDSVSGDKLINEIAQSFINEGSLDMLTINIDKVLHEQGVPSDTINLVIKNFKTNFIALLIPTIKENALIRSTVVLKIFSGQPRK